MLCILLLTISSETQNPYAPWPVPTHMVTIPYLFSYLAYAFHQIAEQIAWHLYILEDVLGQ